MAPGTDGRTASSTGPQIARRYLDLLKRCLTRELFIDEQVEDALMWPARADLGDPEEVWPRLEAQGLRIVRPAATPDQQHVQAHFPPHAETMVGAARLDNVQELVTRVVDEQIPGDLVETGVWRGGTVVLMRALLEVLGDDDRLIWACDSFQGLPPPGDDRHPLDAEWRASYADGQSPLALDLVDQALAVPVEAVKENIDRYGLLDDRIRFVEGWFSESLPKAPIERIAVLRLDGDLYESTMDGLVNLEEKVSPGGFVIVDDYNSIDACRQAVGDYRTERGITDEIREIDWTGVWWRKSGT